MKFFTYAPVLLLFYTCFMEVQGQTLAPAIPHFGPTFPVPNPDFPTDTTREYKVVFDIYQHPDNPEQINPQLNTLARFINMHTQAGVPLEKLHVACVLHNRASIEAVNNEKYQERYGVDNPNIPLMEALQEAGASIYMCGQSMGARGLKREELASPVQVGLSAMTIILSLQQEGYQLIKF